MSPVSGKELSRQFRVLDQTLSMHTMLRDRYARLALILDIMLLACSVTFCATTFARDEAFTKVGLSSQNVRYVLGIASVSAFFASLVALRVDWKGKSALHRDAVQRLTTVLALFRELHRDDGTWPQDRGAELHQAYWRAMNHIVEVPTGAFVGLKARHLRKVKVSKMLDSMPGCPVFVLRFIVLCRYMKKSWDKKAAIEQEPTDGSNSERARHPNKAR